MSNINFRQKRPNWKFLVKKCSIWHILVKIRPNLGQPPSDQGGPEGTSLSYIYPWHQFCQNNCQKQWILKKSMRKDSGSVNFNARSTTIRPPPMDSITTNGFPTLWSTKPNGQFGLKRCRKQWISRKVHCIQSLGLDWNFWKNLRLKVQFPNSSGVKLQFSKI